VRDKSGQTKNGFVWTFNARDREGGLDVAYVFAGSKPPSLHVADTADGRGRIAGGEGDNVAQALVVALGERRDQQGMPQSLLNS
jgi:hypothetical protein